MSTFSCFLSKNFLLEDVGKNYFFVNFCASVEYSTAFSFINMVVFVMFVEQIVILNCFYILSILWKGVVVAFLLLWHHFKKHFSFKLTFPEIKINYFEIKDKYSNCIKFPFTWKHSTKRRTFVDMILTSN